MPIWAMTRISQRSSSRCERRQIARRRTEEERARRCFLGERRRRRRIPSAMREQRFSSVLHLLRATPDGGDDVALVTGGTEVVERVRQLGVSADQVAGFHQ
jgi:hypothetical protein